MFKSEQMLLKRTGTTYSAQGLERLIWDKGAVQAKEEDGSVGQHASKDDQVVHVRTGHFDQPAQGHKRTCWHTKTYLYSGVYSSQGIGPQSGVVGPQRSENVRYSGENHNPCNSDGGELKKL